jgi:hypothetical protein
LRAKAGQRAVLTRTHHAHGKLGVMSNVRFLRLQARMRKRNRTAPYLEARACLDFEPEAVDRHHQVLDMLRKQYPLVDTFADFWCEQKVDVSVLKPSNCSQGWVNSGAVEINACHHEAASEIMTQVVPAEGFDAGASQYVLSRPLDVADRKI